MAEPPLPIPSNRSDTRALPSAPQLPKRPRAAWLSPRSIITFVLILAAYVYGWQITGIDPASLVRNLGRGAPLASSLIEPTVFEPLVDHAEDSLSLAVQPKEGHIEPAQREEKSPGQPVLTVSSREVHAGEEITLMGENFPPNATGRLSWEGEANQQFAIATVTTDAKGSFSTPLKVGDEFAPGYWFVDATFVAPRTWFGVIPAFTFASSFLFLIEKMIETVFLALMGTTLSTIIAVPLSFLAARNLMGGTWPGRSIYFVVRMLFNILRSVEILILVVIFGVIVGFGSYAGILGIVVHGIGAVGKLYAEAIEDIEQGTIEAVRATGAGSLQTVMYGVVPQILPQFVAFTIYRWDINVRMATVLGLVGGGGIGFWLTQYMNMLQWNNAAAAIWLIVIVVMIMDFASGKAREQIV